MKLGKQSWRFENSPVISSAGTSAGPFEAQGPLATDFDVLYDELWLGETSFEKAQQMLFETACNQAMEKGQLTEEDIDFILAGDLSNQMTSTNFGCRSFTLPYIGVFGACSTSMEALALGAFLVNGGGAQHVLAGTTSHNAAVEKIFRYPTEYGSQKPPTAQWTATAGGAAIVSAQGNGPLITHATIGRVIDEGLTDPFNMGAAMAPAAVDTLKAHVNDTGSDLTQYDLVVTGDLGRVGRPLALELLKEEGIDIQPQQFVDTGILMYSEQQNVRAGGSGCGCAAAVTFGHLLKRLENGEWNRIFVIATGALLSPISYQQHETIPCIAHGVVIERGGKQS
ncbi:stage V sporulation protein AD [Salsuginibacillus kocurii]|uniref:stage V sporulation protein AD n=1 Tax=Salsuginibacillus kocurii TaxID=427078 RepID=UPI00036C21C8|nr:stage V sporulation protein AD [Salsuginibacillus kocurii]